MYKKNRNSGSDSSSDNSTIIIIIVIIGCCCIVLSIISSIAAYFLTATTDTTDTTDTGTDTVSGKENETVKNPSVAVGKSITCVGYNPKGSGAVYRYEGNNEIRHYPNPEIASSWNPNWSSTTELNCNGFKLGQDVQRNPSVPITCKADGTWSINTPVNIGVEISRNCPSGLPQFAKCNADGSWSVGECPLRRGARGVGVSGDGVWGPGLMGS